LAPLGETIGGAVREEQAATIRDQLHGSQVAAFVREHGRDPDDIFASYFNVLESELPMLRGGFGIGFERLISFLINSNDIIEAIRYREVAAINR